MTWPASEKKISKHNASLALQKPEDDEEVSRVARGSFHNFILTSLEFVAGTHNRTQVEAEIRGQEFIEKSLTNGRGVYLAAIHMGPWEAYPNILKKFGRLQVLAKKLKPEGLNRFVEERRTTNGFTIIVRKQKGDGYRKIRQAIGSGELVFFPIDQSRPSDDKVPFFGKSARTNTSLAAIFRKHPAPILPVYMQRLSPRKYTLTVLPAIKMEQTDDSAKDIYQNTLLINQTVEAMIMRKPEQYFWLHDRWRLMRN